MKENYDPKSFFDYVGYPSGDQPYYAPGLRTLSVYCRGNRANLETLLAPTPFELIDERFVVQIADFGTASCGPYYDSGIVIPVRYKDTVGANYLFEWEDKSWSVQFGREVWGYPKQFGAISLTEAAGGCSGSVVREGEPVFDISVQPQDGFDTSVWADLKTFPHLQVHYLPEANGPGFKVFEIVARDTSADFRLTSRVSGPAAVRLGPSITVAGVALEVDEVLGGEFTIGDYACTVENGISRVIDSLV